MREIFVLETAYLSTTEGGIFLATRLEIPPFVDRFRALHVAAGYVGVLALLREGATTARRSIRILRSHAWASMSISRELKSIEARDRQLFRNGLLLSATI